jgi:hypothetical protein
MRVSLLVAAFLFLALARGNGQDRLTDRLTSMDNEDRLTTRDIVDTCKTLDSEGPQPWAGPQNPIPPDMIKGLCGAIFSGYALGFVAGSTNHPNPRFCLPLLMGWTPYEGMKDFMHYVKNNPTVLDEKPELVLMKAFRAAYPCNHQQRGDGSYPQTKK